MAPKKIKLNIYSDDLKKLKLVAIAYSFVNRDLFPTEEAYIAEKRSRGPGPTGSGGDQKAWPGSQGIPGGPVFFDQHPGG